MSVTADADLAGTAGWTRYGAMGAASWVLPIVATILATPLVIRAVGVREYGLFVAVNGIMLAFASINLARPVTVASGGDDADVVVPATMTWAAICGFGAAALVVVAVLGGLGDVVGSEDLDSTALGLLAVACIGAVVLNLYNAVTGLLPGLHRVGTASVFVAVTGCLTSVGYVVAARRVGSATAMLAWLVVVLVASSVIQVAIVHRLGGHVLSRRALDRRIVRAAWPATAPFVLTQGIGGVLSVVERVGLARTSGLGALTEFAPPQLMVVAGLGAMWSVVGAMVPQVVRLWNQGETAELLRWVHRTRLALALGSSVAAVALVVLGPQVIDFWLDGTVEVSRSELLPFGVWLVAYCVMGPGMALAESTGQAWANVWLVAASLALMFAVGLPAMSSGGAEGVAIGRAALVPLIVVHAVVVDRRVRHAPSRQPT